MTIRRLGAIALSLSLFCNAAPIAQSPPPAASAPKPRAEVAVAARVLAGYVGRYQLAPAVLLAVTLEGNHLFVQLTDQGAFEVYPESATKFFWKVVDAQITFETDAAGKATGVVLHQMGRDLKALRIEGAPVMPKVVAMSAATFDRYVGRYQLKGVVMSITREGQRFLVSMGSQPTIEIFPSSGREFFLKVVNAQLTFEVTAQGNATAVVLRQDGVEQRATRIQ